MTNDKKKEKENHFFVEDDIIARNSMDQLTFKEIINKRMGKMLTYELKELYNKLLLEDKPTAEELVEEIKNETK